MEISEQNQIQPPSHTESCLHEQVPEKWAKSSGASCLTMMVLLSGHPCSREEGRVFTQTDHPGLGLSNSYPACNLGSLCKKAKVQITPNSPRSSDGWSRAGCSISSSCLFTLLLLGFFCFFCFYMLLSAINDFDTCVYVDLTTSKCLS